MIRFVICLIIVILIYNLFVNSVDRTCVKDNEKIIIERSYGSKIKRNNIFNKLGFNTIRVMLDREIPCGFYEADSHDGPVTIIVGNLNRNDVIVNFIHHTSELESLERFEFWNLKRLSNVQSDVINTYNIGCCS